VNLFKKKIEKPHFELVEYGILKLEEKRDGFEWFGHVTMPIADIPVHLTIEVKNPSEPSNQQIQLINKFVKGWSDTKVKLFKYMTKRFRDSKWDKDKVELEKMYYLSALHLKKDNSEWWIVLEPEIEVPSIFNFFPRFTLLDNEIIWSNLE
jgi:hypothetical protein